MNSREIWHGKSAFALVARILLLPASLLYFLGWQAYLLVYKFGLKRVSEPHFPVIVVGNFSVGGTGKTPIVISIAELLSEGGSEVVIGCSGYGAPRSEGAALAPDGKLSAGEWGDEPALIRELLPQIPIIVGRNRVLAAEICHSNFPNSILLMDDGIQHLPLKSHIRIAVDSKQTGNGFVLPAGPYREPLSSNRVDLMLLERFQVHRELSHFEDQHSNRIQIPLSDPVEARALAAIGNPDLFFAALEKAGLELEMKTALNDHDPLSAGTILTLFDKEIPTIVTLKDWVKLRDLPGISDRKVWIAYETISLEPRQEFANWLHERLQKTKN